MISLNEYINEAKTYNNKYANNDNMIIITPEEVTNKEENKLKSKSVFLAGTIDNGNSLNWQDKTINKLIKLGVKNLEIYNPRRKHWNSTQEEMEYQIKWEQDHLDKADVIVMVLLDDSKSPISLLELGLYAKTNKMIVFCTPKFYRFDNIRLTCQKYKIELVQDIHPSIIANKIISHI